MTKYRLLKDLPGIDKGEEGTWERFRFTRDYLLEKGFIEEIKEEPNPKFKIGDYVVYEGKNIEYMKIFLIKQSGGNFVYNSSPTADGYSVSYYESHLRRPTQEELEKYFR